MSNNLKRRAHVADEENEPIGDDVVKQRRLEGDEPEKTDAVEVVNQPEQASSRLPVKPEVVGNGLLRLRNLNELVNVPEERVVVQKHESVEVGVVEENGQNPDSKAVNPDFNEDVELAPKQDGTSDREDRALQLLRKQLAPVRDRSYSPEVRELAERLSEMFPNTPLGYLLHRYLLNYFSNLTFIYLLHRCEDLVDKPAAMERFTEELLTSPNPPPHWNQELQVGPGNVAEIQSVAGTSSGSTATTPKKALNPLEDWKENCLNQLNSMFPNVCPDHLLTQVQAITGHKERVGEEVTGADNTKFQQLVENMWNNKQLLPTRQEYEKRKKEQKELERWAGAMTAERFLELYPDPKDYFMSPTRKELLASPAYFDYFEHARDDLLRRFPLEYLNTIENALRMHKSYILTVRHLQSNKGRQRKNKRSKFEMKYPKTPVCLEFLKEKKYLELEGEIAQMKLDKEILQKQLIEEARAAGLLVECGCCFKDDCLEQEMVPCKAKHLHCVECIAGAGKVAAGENKTGVACPQCDDEIGWQELQKALEPNILSKLLQRRQAEEVGAAGMEDLVTCPFCPYQAIMENTEDKVLVCRNPDCGRESCRLCKESNHVPLRCDEVEKGESTRKKIEEKLTEAMLRECWKCNKKV